MDLKVNGKIITLPKGSTIIDVLNHINSPHSVAVFVNERQILLRQYKNYVLNNKDNIRVLRPLGGG